MSDSLIAVLAEAPAAADGPAGMTTREIAGATGWHRNIVRQRLAEAIQRGHVQFAGHRVVVRIDGQHGRDPVYQVVANDEPIQFGASGLSAGELIERSGGKNALKGRPINLRAARGKP